MESGRSTSPQTGGYQQVDNTNGHSITGPRCFGACHCCAAPHSYEYENDSAQPSYASPFYSHQPLSVFPSHQHQVASVQEPMSAYHPSSNRTGVEHPGRAYRQGHREHTGTPPAPSLDSPSTTQAHDAGGFSTPIYYTSVRDYAYSLPGKPSVTYSYFPLSIPSSQPPVPINPHPALLPIALQPRADPLQVRPRGSHQPFSGPMPNGSYYDNRPSANNGPNANAATTAPSFEVAYRPLNGPPGYVGESQQEEQGEVAKNGSEMMAPDDDSSSEWDTDDSEDSGYETVAVRDGRIELVGDGWEVPDPETAMHEAGSEFGMTEIHHSLVMIDEDGVIAERVEDEAALADLTMRGGRPI
ncbi:hypothetical protein GGR52DRAFT_540528, partial [Hypoxylon sp. FL1284]